MADRDEDVIAAYAAKFIGATLGVEVEPWDVGGRQGAHDLRYEHEGRVVAVEVKSLLDADFQQMQAEINRREYQPVDRLKRFWIVHLRHGANVRAVRQHLPDVLVLLDEIGYEDLPLRRLRQRLPNVAARLDALGVRRVSPTAPTERHPGGYLLLPTSWGGFGTDDLDQLVDFASTCLASDRREMQRLRQQLRDADADERHAFLLVGSEYPEGWSLKGTAPGPDVIAMPPAAPRLPEPIDGLWLASFSFLTRVIAWLPGRGGWIEGQRGDEP
jgi:hypothetical protein